MTTNKTVEKTTNKEDEKLSTIETDLKLIKDELKTINEEAVRVRREKEIAERCAKKRKSARLTALIGIIIAILTFGAFFMAGFMAAGVFGTVAKTLSIVCGSTFFVILLTLIGIGLYESEK